jgi:hypothetical protein
LSFKNLSSSLIVLVKHSVEDGDGKHSRQNPHDTGEGGGGVDHVDGTKGDSVRHISISHGLSIVDGELESACHGHKKAQVNVQLVGKGRTRHLVQATQLLGHKDKAKSMQVAAQDEKVSQVVLQSSKVGSGSKGMLASLHDAGAGQSKASVEGSEEQSHKRTLMASSVQLNSQIHHLVSEEEVIAVGVKA